MSPISPVVSEISSIKNLNFCKECMSIGDLSLYQPVFSQFSVAAISLDCYLSHSSSDLNQRWRLQRILNAPPPPPPPTPCQPKSLHHRLISNLISRVITYWGAEGGEGSKVARGWRKMSRGLSFSPHFRLRRACSQAILYTYLFNCGYWSESITFTAVWW